MGRLQVASGLFQIFMLSERDSFLKEPYLHAQHALMLADILLAAHALGGPQASRAGEIFEPLSDVGTDANVKGH